MSLITVKGEWVGYHELPEAVKQYVTLAEYAMLSNRERAELVDSFTTPEEEMG